MTGIGANRELFFAVLECLIATGALLSGSSTACDRCFGNGRLVYLDPTAAFPVAKLVASLIRHVKVFCHSCSSMAWTPTEFSHI